MAQGHILLKNFNNVEYYAAISIGTPPQEFEVGAYSGFGVVWVIGGWLVGVHVCVCSDQTHPPDPHTHQNPPPPTQSHQRIHQPNPHHQNQPGDLRHGLLQHLGALRQVPALLRRQGALPVRGIQHLRAGQSMALRLVCCVGWGRQCRCYMRGGMDGAVVSRSSLVFVCVCGCGRMHIPRRKSPATAHFPPLISQSTHTHIQQTHTQNGTLFKVRYGSGAVQGFFAQDNMEVAGYKITNQIFAEVTDASGLGRTYQVGGWGWVGLLGGWNGGWCGIADVHVSSFDQGIHQLHIHTHTPEQITDGEVRRHHGHGLRELGGGARGHAHEQPPRAGTLRCVDRNVCVLGCVLGWGEGEGRLVLCGRVCCGSCEQPPRAGT